MTWPKISYPIYNLTLTLNRVEEGKARMGEGMRDEEVASSKKKRIKD